jgi:hypothetical protein
VCACARGLFVSESASRPAALEGRDLRSRCCRPRACMGRRQREPTRLPAALAQGRQLCGDCLL